MISRFVKIVAVLAAGLLTPGIVVAQGTYSPGQTFSSAPGAGQTPAPYSQQVVPQRQVQEFDLPVQQRVQPAAATPYNMGSRPAAQQTTRQQAPQRVRVTEVQDKPRAAVKEKAEAKDSKSERHATPKEKNSAAKEQVSAAKTEKVTEVAPVSAPAKPDAIPEASEADTPSDTKAEAPTVAEPTDKLVFFSRKTGKKQVALTYDDGPNPAFTPRLAQWLKENNVPATFFVCGNMVKEHPDHVKKLAEDGFELANHTYSHPDLRKLSPEQITAQIQDTHDEVKAATGIDMNLLRPPYGAHNSKVDSVCEKLGYKIINWDVDTEDWRKRSTVTMMNTIMSKTGDGSIILMHDRKHGGKDTVLETTQQAVKQLRAKGYTFVSVGELLEMPKQGTGNSVKTASATASPVSIPLVSTSGVVTTTTLGQALPTPAVMTPVPVAAP